MREYTEYMDSISAGNELHEKIMARIEQSGSSPPRRRALPRYAGLAACTAVLLLCVWAAPLLGGLRPITGGPTSSGDNAPPQLTLNKADSQTAASIHIPGHFWYGLTGGQLAAVLPEFNFTLLATVNYSGDGSIFNVVAYEAGGDSPTDPARFGEYYTRTEIQLAPGEVVEDVIYNYAAKTTDVYGTAVVAGVFYGNEHDGVALYIASFKIDDIAYSIKLHDSDTGGSGPARLAEIVGAIIKKGAADLSVLIDPVIPELRDEQLTLEEAHSDPNFGAYLPGSIPPRFGFGSAQRFLNQSTDALFTHWYAGYDYIDWRVSAPAEYDLEHIVHTDEREKYDLSLYPIPRADSVPRELWGYVDSPVFLAGEFTLDVIRARAYYVDNDRGDAPGWRMNFNVLFDGADGAGSAVVSVNIKGASPEQVWEMFAELMG